MKESAVTSHIRLEAAQRNVALLRNNSGAFKNEHGGFVRFGLGNFTDKDELASSDFIGWTPVFITPDMVGKVLAVFTAVETKPSDWKFSNADKRALHQRNFIDMVINAGGKAGFAKSVEDLRIIIE